MNDWNVERIFTKVRAEEQLLVEEADLLFRLVSYIVGHWISRCLATDLKEFGFTLPSSEKVWLKIISIFAGFSYGKLEKKFYPKIRREIKDQYGKFCCISPDEQKALMRMVLIAVHLELAFTKIRCYMAQESLEEYSVEQALQDYSNTIHP